MLSGIRVCSLWVPRPFGKSEQAHDPSLTVFSGSEIGGVAEFENTSIHEITTLGDKTHKGDPFGPRDSPDKKEGYSVDLYPFVDTEKSLRFIHTDRH